MLAGGAQIWCFIGIGKDSYAIADDSMRGHYLKVSALYLLQGLIFIVVGVLVLGGANVFGH